MNTLNMLRRSSTAIRIIMRSINKHNIIGYVITSLYLGPGIMILPAAEAVDYAQQPWRSLGPSNIVASVGRMTCIAVHPFDNNRIYAGSASGGLWFSPDGGSNWRTLTDYLPELGTSSVAIDPVNPSTIYLGTGGATPDIGVLKSTDAGLTWNPTGLSQGAYHLLIDPSNTSRVLAATWEGIFLSTDAGQTWRKTYSRTALNVRFQPTNPRVAYLAGVNQFARSLDAGETWSEQVTGLPPTTDVYNSQIAVTSANPLSVYILYLGLDGDYYGLFRSTDGGGSFAKMSLKAEVPTAVWGGCNGCKSFQGTYDLALAVSPTNFDEVYVGGVSLIKSIDGGVHWRNIQQGVESGYIHSDVAVLECFGSTLFACTDGGLHKTPDGGANWIDLSSGLSVAQIYKIGTSEDSSVIYAGEQDNGLNRLTEGVWEHVRTGDYYDLLVDQQDANTIYALSNGKPEKTTNAWAHSFTLIMPPTQYDYGFPLVMDPHDSKVLFAGLYDIYKTSDGGDRWSRISDFGDPLGCEDISVSRSDPETIYVARSDYLWYTTNGGGTWERRHPPVDPYRPNKIALSSVDSRKVWIASGSKVFSSVDAGSNWTDYTGTLPPRYIRAIVYQNSSLDAVYLGMDAGVYYRNKLMDDWQVFGTNLPNARISDIKIQYTSRDLLTATFGRGLWACPLPAVLGITTQPKGQTSRFGSTVGFSVDCIGISPINYQWRYNEVDIPSATNSTLILNNVQSSDAGRYSVVAKNVEGDVISDAATLVLESTSPAPVVWRNPDAITYGSPLTTNQLNATSVVSGLFTYVPPLGTVLPAGTYTLSAIFSPTDAGNYRMVTNSVALTVLRRGFGILLDNKRRPFGTPNPPFTYSIQGLVNGDTNIVFEPEPIITTTANQNSPPGNYPISIYGAGLGTDNYTIGWSRDGTLTVLGPPLSIGKANGVIVISWTTNFAGFDIESTFNPLSASWTLLDRKPTIVDGQNSVTISSPNGSQFFRLRQTP